MLDGGENLLEVVDKLTAEAAAQEAALQAQKAAEAASLSRIAQLEEEHVHNEEQYSSVQVSICDSVIFIQASSSVHLLCVCLLHSSTLTLKNVKSVMFFSARRSSVLHN